MERSIKRLLIIFVLAYLTNAVWENLHVFLYDNYKGGEITEFILLRAALADAGMIMAITAPFVFCRSLRKHSWAIVATGVVVAIALEKYALAAGWWVYAPSMPIIPFVLVGLTPTVQLGLLGYLSYKVSEGLSTSS